MKTFRILFLSAIFLLGACSKHADKPSKNMGRTDFGTLIGDTRLNLSNVKPLKEKVFATHSVVSVNSADWFRLADLLMQDDDGDLRLKKTGESLLESFYKIPRSTTTITPVENPPGSPYGGAALWFAKPILAKKLSQLFETAIGKVEETASHIQVDLSDLKKPYPPPEEVLQKIITSLKDFKNNLIDQTNEPRNSVLDAVKTSLESKYIADLEELLMSVTWPENIPLSASLQKLEGTLSHIAEVSPFQRRHLLNQVGLAVALSAQNEAVHDPEAFMVFLGDVWLAKDMRKNYPERIKKIFQGLTDQQLFALATSNEPNILQTEEWNHVINEKDTIPLPDRSLIALYLENAGDTLSKDDFADSTFQARAKELDDALDEPEFSELARVMANAPSDSKVEQKFALVSAWLSIPERSGLPKQLKDVFKNLKESEIEMMTQKSSFNVNSAENIEEFNRWVGGVTKHPDGVLPQSVVEAFSSLDQGVKRITAKGSISLTSRLHFSLSKFRFGIIRSLSEPNNLEKFKADFSEAITHATRERLDLALMPIAESLGNEIKDSIIPELEEKSKKAQENISTTINQYGRYYLGKLVFKIDGLQKNEAEADPIEDERLKKTSLPFLENSKLQYSVTSKKWSNALVSDESSAEVLGMSMSLFPRRIGVSPLNANDNTPAFSQLAQEYVIVSKLLAVAGYHDPTGNLISSLSVGMENKNAGDFLDIPKYDPAQEVFATPDALKITNQYFLDSSSRINPNVSVSGQMALLEGYTQLMNYLKPWGQSPFDSSLGALRIDEEPTLKPFNKDDFFLLSTGLGAAILKNVPYKMLGLITTEDTYLDGTKLEDPASASVIGAVLTDYNRDGVSHHVFTKNIAQAISAMSGFYEATADLNLATHPMIVSSVGGEKLATARNTLQKLIVGMILFSSSHLMLEDGGFAQGFDLDKMQVEGQGTRSLEDQLFMEEALIRAGRVFGSGFMVSRALDNFYFLNDKFWNENLGFYRSSETQTQAKVLLVDVARAVKIVKEAISLDVTQGPKGSSLAQMEKLLSLWKNRFFSDQFLSQDVVTLLSDFSL